MTETPQLDLLPPEGDGALRGDWIERLARAYSLERGWEPVQWDHATGMECGTIFETKSAIINDFRKAATAVVPEYAAIEPSDLVLKILAALGHTPKVSDDCTARVVHEYPAGRPPGPQNPPIFCCLKVGHEGPHRCNHGGMTFPSFPFRETDKVEFREPATYCSKCRTVWPCPDAKAAINVAIPN